MFFYNVISIFLIADEINACVVSNQENLKNILGKFSFGMMNINGLCLSFSKCANNLKHLISAFTKTSINISVHTHRKGNMSSAVFPDQQHFQRPIMDFYK